VCIHHVPAGDALPYSHAYAPCAAFDEVVQRGNWLCLSKDDGFFALYSQHPIRWLQDNEVRADAPDNIWLCELGTRQQWGSFSSFVQAVTASTVTCEGLQAYYKSPSQGWFEFGWHGPLRVQGQPVALRGYKRFDSPYCRAEFGDLRMTIRCGEQSHTLDLTDATT